MRDFFILKKYVQATNSKSRPLTQFLKCKNNTTNKVLYLKKFFKGFTYDLVNKDIKQKAMVYGKQLFL